MSQLEFLIVMSFTNLYLPTHLLMYLPTPPYTHTPTFLKAVVLGLIISEFEAPKFHS